MKPTEEQGIVNASVKVADMLERLQIATVTLSQLQRDFINLQQELEALYIENAS